MKISLHRQEDNIKIIEKQFIETLSKFLLPSRKSLQSQSMILAQTLNTFSYLLNRERDRGISESVFLGILTTSTKQKIDEIFQLDEKLKVNAKQKIDDLYFEKYFDYFFRKFDELYGEGDSQDLLPEKQLIIHYQKKLSSIAIKIFDFTNRDRLTQFINLAKCKFLQSFAGGEQHEKFRTRLDDLCLLATDVLICIGKLPVELQDTVSVNCQIVIDCIDSNGQIGTIDAEKLLIYPKSKELFGKKPHLKWAELFGENNQDFIKSLESKSLEETKSPAHPKIIDKLFGEDSDDLLLSRQSPLQKSPRKVKMDKLDEVKEDDFVIIESSKELKQSDQKQVKAVNKIQFIAKRNIQVIQLSKLSLADIKEIKKNDGQSGHESYKFVLRLIGSLQNILMFFKLNKNNKFVLSIVEVLATVFWNVLLPDYSSTADFVFDENNQIVGVISPAIKGFGMLKRNVAYKEKEKYLDYYSLAGVFTYTHALFEDDLHRENLSLVAISWNQLSLFKIDNDMTFQTIAERNDSSYAGLNVRKGRFIPEFVDFITATDCITSPFFKDFQPHFKPGQSRFMVGGEKKNSDNLKKNILNKTKKGWGAPKLGIDNLTEQHKWLEKNLEYQKYKWYHYVKFIMIPIDIFAKQLDLKIQEIPEGEEKYAAKRVKIEMLNECHSRQKRFFDELIKIPYFFKTLYEYKEEFLLRMELDNFHYEIKYHQSIMPLKLEAVYDSILAKYPIKISSKVTSEKLAIMLLNSLNYSVAICKSVEELIKVRDFYSEMMDKWISNGDASQNRNLKKTLLSSIQKVDESINLITKAKKIVANVVAYIEKEDTLSEVFHQFISTSLSDLLTLFDMEIGNYFYQQAQQEIFWAISEEKFGLKYKSKFDACVHTDKIEQRLELIQHVKKWCQPHMDNPIHARWVKVKISELEILFSKSELTKQRSVESSVLNGLFGSPKADKLRKPAPVSLAGMGAGIF